MAATAPSHAYREPYQYVSHLFSFYDCVTRSASTNPKATKTTARQGPLRWIWMGVDVAGLLAVANMPICNRERQKDKGGPPCEWNGSCPGGKAGAVGGRWLLSTALSASELVELAERKTTN